MDSSPSTRSRWLELRCMSVSRWSGKMFYKRRRYKRLGGNDESRSCLHVLYATPAPPYWLGIAQSLFSFVSELKSDLAFCGSGARVHPGQLSSHELHDLGRYVRRRLDGEGWLGGNLVNPHQFPCRGSRIAVVGGLVEDHGIGAIKKLHGGNFEVFSGGIEHAQIDVWTQKTNDAVGLHDHVFRAGDFSLNVRDGLAEAALAGAHPDGAVGAGNQETRGIGLAAAVTLVAQGAEMVVAGIAVARLAVGRADAVAELRDLERCPVIFRQRR